MNITLELIAGKVPFNKNTGGFQQKICIGDHYELRFEINTEKYNIEVLCIHLYFHDNLVYIDTDIGLEEPIPKFNERLKIFMDGLMHGTVAILNFNGDNEDNFLGFEIKSGNKIIRHSDDMVKLEYNLSSNDPFTRDLKIIIDQLHLM